MELSPHKLTRDDLIVVAGRLLERGDRRHPVIVKGDEESLQMARAALATMNVELVAISAVVEDDCPFKGEPLIAAFALYDYDKPGPAFFALNAPGDIEHAFNSMITNRCVILPV